MTVDAVTSAPWQDGLLPPSLHGQIHGGFGLCSKGFRGPHACPACEPMEHGSRLLGPRFDGLTAGWGASIALGLGRLLAATNGGQLTQM